MAIRKFSVGPKGGLRLAAATDLPNLVAIAGPNGAGKSTMLDLIRANRQTVEPDTKILFTGPHRTWRNSNVTEVSTLGWTFDYSDVLMQDNIPGNPYQAPGLNLVYGQQRLSSSADDSQALVKTGIVRIRNKRRKLIEKQFDAQGKQIQPKTVPDLFEPFATLVSTLLPHLHWEGIDDSNENNIRCLFLPTGRRDMAPFDIDDLSSGEKAAIALFLPFIEQEVTVMLETAGAKTNIEVAKPDPAAFVPYTMLLDEPEIHLHPLLQLNALEYMRNLAKERRCQFIFATQSPTFLDALADEELYLLSPAELAPENQLSRLTDSWERLDLVRSLTGSTHTLTRCKPIVFIEGIPDKSVTASDERLLKLLAPATAHWALVATSGRKEVVRAVKQMRQSEVNLPGMPIFGLVDADTDNAELPEFVVPWPVTMLENLLLDAPAIWRVLSPYAGNLPLKSEADVSRTLLAAATSQEENEVRLRVIRKLPVAYIRVDAFDYASASSAADVEYQKLARAIQAVDFDAVVRDARDLVSKIVSEKAELERYHGKNILDSWLKDHSICNLTGLSRNAFLTQLAQEAAKSARTQKLTEEAIGKIRLYFPAGLETLLDGTNADEQGLIEQCQNARRLWELGKAAGDCREQLRSRLTATARTKQQSLEQDVLKAGQELMRVACAIGTGA